MQDKKLARFVNVDICPKCEGIWFDHGELKELLQARFSERADPRTLLPADRDADCLCPDCRWPLYRREFMRRSNIEIEQCIKCAGIFLDAGEVDQVIAFLKSIGIEVNEEWLPPQEEDQ